MTNPYSVLGVPSGTSLQSCKKKAKQLLKKYHPDNGGDPEKYQQVQDALRIIESGNAEMYEVKKHLTHVSIFHFAVSESA